MPANIAEINGRSAVFTARKSAWHNLGVTTLNCLTWSEAIQEGNLNWEVIKKQLSLGNIPIPAYGMFRYEENNPVFLGHCGENYEPLQNEQMFDFVDTVLAAKDGAHYDTAGALGNGEKIWCLADINERFEIAPGDEHKQYLAFISSHDGSIASTSFITDIRIVCQNTMNQALSSNGQTFVKVRHTKRSHERLDEAKKVLSNVCRDIGDLKERLSFLAHKKMTRETFIQVMERLFPGEDNTRKKNVIQEVIALFESNDGNMFPQIKGTAYNLLNAVTEYADHQRGTRKTENFSSENEARSTAAIFGSGDKLKKQAIEVLMETVSSNPSNSWETVVVDLKTPQIGGGSLLDDVLMQPIR